MKKISARIVTGTALSLLMASAASGATAQSTFPYPPAVDRMITGAAPHLLLAQTEPPAEETEEERLLREAKEAEAAAAKAEADAAAEAEAAAAKAAADAAAEEAAEPVVEEPVAPAEAPAEAPAAPAEAPVEAPAEAPAVPVEEPAEAPAEAPAAVEPTDAENVLPENAAPVLDSAKNPEAGTEQTTAPAVAPADAPPPPTSDSAAQSAVVAPAEIQPVTAEQGTRVQGDQPRRRERPEGTDVLREIGDRVIIEFNNQIIVQSNDRPRMTRGATEVYYEDLPRGRTRETIVRENGVTIVTIRDRYGDVIRRSRITPDGREYVLTYVDEDRRGGRGADWRDPGLDLAPLVLTIPVSEYILDARRARDADAYYDFLYQPPVEQVQRLYSVDEVKRSARVRDSVRRVDLDTITFEFGSASIAESEIARLEGVAVAMQRLLERNPGETFLIEGHTDAVGSDYANLALSDQRAESVAQALTNVFDIPPENLATQGYGEQYLKVATEAPERLNRRVAIRRITPLVAPVASAQ